MGYGPFSTPPIEGGGGGGGVSGLATADGGTAIADNAIIRGDGTEGIQGSAFTLSDTGALSMGALDMTFGSTSGRVIFNTAQPVLSYASFEVYSYLYARRNVQASTSGPVTVSPDLFRRAYSNEGAGAPITYNLPSASVGMEMVFIVHTAQDMVVTASAGDTIRVAASVSSSGGTATNGTVGGVLHLLAINATEWVSIATTGTWTTA